MYRYKTVKDIFLYLVFPELLNTLYMLVFTLIFSFVLGSIIALIMIYTSKNGLRPNKYVHNTLEVVIDIFMSMPLVILAVTIFPFTRMIVGTYLGKTAALVPLTIAITPVFAKFFYDGLLEVNKWVIQAASSFGASDLQILWIMVKETVPSIISGTTLASISTLAATSMVGAIGAGGVGYVALAFGYKVANFKVVWVVVAVLIVITQTIQFVGERIYKKWR